VSLPAGATDARPVGGGDINEAWQVRLEDLREEDPGIEAELRAVVERAGAGVVAAANFSRGANLLDALAERAGRLFADAQAYDAWIHEAHHRAKKDAPSGTALMLLRALERGGYPKPVDVSSTRAGFIPGTHTVGFDGPAETLTLTHSVRDRSTFAHGALEAARWVVGRHGWFTMQDVLGLTEVGPEKAAGEGGTR